MHGDTSTTEFAGMRVLITGAAQGIGAAVAYAFARRRADIVLIDRQSSVSGVAGMIAKECGISALAWCVDIADRNAVQAAIHDIESNHGPIDVLAHVAGILLPATALHVSAQDWREMFAVNTDGVFNVTQCTAQFMARRRQGTIVTVGSNAAAVPRTQMAAYAASKAAAWQYVRCLGLELAPFGIRCNNVSPGSTETAMQQQLWSDGASIAQVIGGNAEQYRLGIPLQRIATPQDIANAVCFLASNNARHITLHDLRVDGGATLDA